MKNKISNEEELDMKCALAEKIPCVFVRFLIGQGWITDTKCCIDELAKKQFEKYLRDLEHQKNEKDRPDES